jgi:hypothetical protein
MAATLHVAGEMVDTRGSEGSMRTSRFAIAKLAFCVLSLGLGLIGQGKLKGRPHMRRTAASQ